MRDCSLLVVAGDWGVGGVVAVLLGCCCCEVAGDCDRGGAAIGYVVEGGVRELDLGWLAAWCGGRCCGSDAGCRVGGVGVWAACAGTVCRYVAEGCWSTI